MFESLISSRIRRTLLEYLLAHPDRRFYLRGLARELSLAVSPLRRELKHLEDAGILRAYDEGNMRFYLVDQAHPSFLQLQQAVAGARLDTGTPAPMRGPSHPAAVMPVAAVVAAEPVPAIGFGGFRTIAAWSLIISLLSGMVWLGLHSRQMVAGPAAQPVVKAQTGDVVRPASGEMHSSRWRLAPGAIGGFSSGSR